MNPQTTQQNAASIARTAQARGTFRMWPKVLMLGGLAASFVPVVGGGISHFFDRAKNTSDAKHELKVRADFYRPQIAKTLGMSPDRVSAGDFAKAASINPELRRVYDEVWTKKANEDKQSLLINGGVTAASFVPIPGAGAAAKVVGDVVSGSKIVKGGVQMAKVTAGAMAGGKVAGVLAKDQLNAQELIEALEQSIHQADMQGVDRKQVINPQLIFMLRVAQDELFAKQVKQQFGAPIHKMAPEQVAGVMQAYPALANASVREAHAVAQGILPVRDLGASAPNLSGGFAVPMAAAQPVSQVDRLMQQRAAAAQQQGVGA
jgi:hypothetical protein